MRRAINTLIAIAFIITVTETAHAWFWDKPKEEKAARNRAAWKSRSSKTRAKTQQKPAAKMSEKAKLDAEKKRRRRGNSSGSWWIRSAKRSITWNGLFIFLPSQEKVKA